MQPDFHLDVYKLVLELEQTQWQSRDVRTLVPDVPVLTRQALQAVEVNRSLPYASSSGSTGEPVFVQKYYAQRVWHWATNIRELLWLGWNVQGRLGVVTAYTTRQDDLPWTLNPYLFGPVAGRYHTHPLQGDLQHWVDHTGLDYLHTYPSVMAGLDTSRLKGVKSTGERGATNYSCEELGTIALLCPDNPAVYHVMENIVVEVEDDGSIVATDLTHPYLKRYRLGDKGELTTCRCGRGLQSLRSDVLGRVRNKVVYPDGSQAWPSIGAMLFRHIAPGLQRVQAVQESAGRIRLKVQGDVADAARPAIAALVRQRLGHPFEIVFEQVSGFPAGKFEEFICQVSPG